MKFILSFFFLVVLLTSFPACRFSNSYFKYNAQETAELTKPLEYLHRISDNKLGNVMILMHGLGSDEKDLYPIGEQLDDSWSVFSVRAPLTHTNGRFSWYKMNIGNGVKDRSITDIKTSAELIEEFINYAKTKYNLQDVDFYIGGFSQGSIMSFYLGLTQPDLVKGLACFSGLLLDDIEKMSLDKAKIRDLNIFLSHGMLDNVISVDEARKAKAFLEPFNVQLNYNEYPVKHSISNQNFKDFIEWSKTLP